MKEKLGKKIAKGAVTVLDTFLRVDVKPQIISGDFRRLFQTETPVTVCGQ